ncbi:TPA: ferredoxin, partial [Clostridioides difficile]|nr:ferredoxin [Clostridioides difficile]
MEKELVFAGFGGQGVLTLGLIVAESALELGKQVTW